MFKPLMFGLPVIILIVIAFVVGMNTVPFSSPYFIYVIIGYVVLFPLALAVTIIATIRSARRVLAGGDPSLKERGERTMATVISARPLNMTMRVGGGPRMQMSQVRLKPDNNTPEISVKKAGHFFQGVPEPGDRVPVYLDRDNAKNHFIDWAASSGAGRVAGGRDMGDLVAHVQAALAQAGQAAGTLLGGTPTGATASAVTPLPAHEPRLVQPPAESHEIGYGIEGRARIEGLKPYPDGTYDLDLYVTPRGKSSYRVAARVPVPAGRGLPEKGQTLKVRIDPDIASRVEVIWD